VVVSGNVPKIAMKNIEVKNNQRGVSDKYPRMMLKIGRRFAYMIVFIVNRYGTPSNCGNLSCRLIHL
jgi:hypothetical protein